MGRKKIQISRITDERNRQVFFIFFASFATHLNFVIEAWDTSIASDILTNNNNSIQYFHRTFPTIQFNSKQFRWRLTNESLVLWRKRTSCPCCATVRSRWSSSAPATSCTSTPPPTWTRSSSSTQSTMSLMSHSRTRTSLRWVMKMFSIMKYGICEWLLKSNVCFLSNICSYIQL